MGTAPIRSMTGYGEAERELDPGRLRVEIRTVNNRYLNVQFRAPPGLERYQTQLERALKDHFARGQVTLSISLDQGGSGRGGGPIRVDLERARSLVDSIRTLSEELDLDGAIDLALVSRYRGVLEEVDAEAVAAELDERLLFDVVGEAAGNAVKVREEEGAFLRDDLVARLDAMSQEIDRLEELAPSRLISERDRLREAIDQLLEGEVQVDEDRIAREIAHLAERWDIHEELVRFRSHVEMFRATLRDGESGGVGKRLGFIAQELLREANTLGSKANDARMAESVVTLKGSIDRVREQIENVE